MISDAYNKNGRRILAIGVWKDRLTYSESVQEAESLLAGQASLKLPFECGVAPSPIAYHAVKARLDEAGLITCAQNIMWHEPAGSYIGEVTTRMLADLGIRFSIVGHSERRLTFGETDEVVRGKFRTCVDADIFPVVCIGDTAEQRAQGSSWKHLETQIGAVLRDPLPPVTSFALAYEPVWAISTWRNAEPLPTGIVVNEIHLNLRRVVENLIGSQYASELSILYGGSVNPANGFDYLVQPNVDGALIGGASKTAESLLATFRACSEGFLSR